MIINAPLPTIRDGVQMGEVSNARKNIKATRKQRTDLTLIFNKKVINFCIENNINYIDFDDCFLGEGGEVDEYFLNTDPKDHHYDELKYSKELIRYIPRSYVS